MAVLLIVSFATAVMLNLVPGNPAYVLAGDQASEETIAALNEQYGFNKPVTEQYASWLQGVASGDLGQSYRTRQPVMESISDRAPITMQLAVLAILLSLAVSIPLALFAAYFRDSPFDRAVNSFTSGALALPSFVTALVLIYVFAVRLNWFPVTGWTKFSENPVGSLRSAALPVVALSLPMIAVFQRVLRADVISTLNQDHVALARSKGLPTQRILTRHALRPSSFSLLTVAGVRFAELIGGTIVIESVFAIPGLGTLMIQSIVTRDLVVVQGLVAVIALAYLLVNLVVDLLYAALDPRISS